MPKYPTNLKRGPARPSTAPGVPGLDTRKPGTLVPFPAPNDNDPFRSKPLKNPRDFGRRFSPPKVPRPPRLPVPPVLLAPLILGPAIEGFLREPADSGPNFSNPGEWWLRHGPNTYTQPAYAQNNHKPSKQWHQGEYGPETGPETEKITGQSVTFGSTGPGAAPKYSWQNWLSVWISNQPGSAATRYAQYQMWQKSTDEAYFRARNLPNAAEYYAVKPTYSVDPFILLQNPTQPGLPLELHFQNPKPPAVAPQGPLPEPKGPAPKAQWDRGWHYRQPPGRGTKERKSKLRRGFDRVMDIFGDVTEIADIIDAAWDALPERCRTKTYYKGRIVTSAQDRWSDVYKCAGHMDVDLFIKNLIDNHVEDMLIGWTNRLRNKVIPDGIDGIDLFRWLDRALFDGELSRHLDLSGVLPKFRDLPTPGRDQEEKGK